MCAEISSWSRRKLSASGVLGVARCDRGGTETSPPLPIESLKLGEELSYDPEGIR